MKTGLTTFARCLATSSLLIGTFSALAQQPTIILPASSSIGPDGIGATSSELLFSQPYCDFPGNTPQPRGVYSATSFAPVSPGVVDATMTKIFDLPVQSGCSGTQGAENYFVISLGAGGFKANSVYSTTPNGSGGDAVYRDGAPFINSITDSAPGHAGIAFDTVGSFNNALIVTTSAGVFGYDSGGNHLFTFLAPVNQAFFENAAVAPLTNTGALAAYTSPLTPSGEETAVSTPSPHIQRTDSSPCSSLRFLASSRKASNS